jgi:cobaltochelatase CobN
MRVLCLIATEDRLWNMRRALKDLRDEQPVLVDGVCWSVWELSQHPEKLEQMMADAETCDFAVIYFHGGAQNIPDFHLLWARLTARMPIYFESSLPDEMAELLPTSGIAPEDYQAIQGYFRYGDEENFRAMLLHIAVQGAHKCCP